MNVVLKYISITMARNPLLTILGTHKLTYPNDVDCLRNLKVILTLEKNLYVLKEKRPTALPEGSFGR